eukprot:TRINITY_DN79069_c0_g1_i1.p1 TRINITY_DN79069_c0_g1~~TRINITY_DN79069_c0_g1_i1.p1  ORF type:complete len:484 (-),score=60.33 TRINITY_DN79069_c0_g1_i1:24-1475(-)
MSQERLDAYIKKQKADAAAEKKNQCHNLLIFVNTWFGTCGAKLTQLTATEILWEFAEWGKDTESRPIRTLVLINAVYTAACVLLGPVILWLNGLTPHDTQAEEQELSSDDEDPSLWFRSWLADVSQLISVTVPALMGWAWRDLITAVSTYIAGDSQEMKLLTWLSDSILLLLVLGLLHSLPCVRRSSDKAGASLQDRYWKLPRSLHLAFGAAVNDFCELAIAGWMTDNVSETPLVVIVERLTYFQILSCVVVRLYGLAYSKIEESEAAKKEAEKELLEDDDDDDVVEEVQVEEFTIQFWRVAQDGVSFVWGFGLYSTLVTLVYAFIFERQTYRTEFIFAFVLTGLFQYVVRTEEHHKARAHTTKMWGLIMQSKLPFVVGVSWASGFSSVMQELVVTEWPKSRLKTPHRVLPYITVFCIWWVFALRLYHAIINALARILEDLYSTGDGGDTEIALQGVEYETMLHSKTSYDSRASARTLRGVRA